MDYLIGLAISQIEVHHRKIFLFGVLGFLAAVISVVVMHIQQAHEGYLELALSPINFFLISCSLWLLKYALILHRKAITECDLAIRRGAVKAICMSIDGCYECSFYLLIRRSIRCSITNSQSFLICS